MTYKYGNGLNYNGLWLAGSLRDDRKVNHKEVA